MADTEAVQPDEILAPPVPAMELGRPPAAVIEPEEDDDEEDDNGVEVLTTRPPTPTSEIEAHRPPSEMSTAIELAAAAALVPGVPGRDEFLALAAQARILHMSGAAPKAIRRDVYVAFHVALIGRDLGISPSAAMQMIDVIGEGDDVQVSISPELKVAQVKRKGLGSVELLRDPDYDTATAIALRPGGFIRRDVDGQPAEIVGEIGRSTFTWEDAMVAGLVDTRCADAKSHWIKPNTAGRSYEDRCRCRQGWRTYPRRMLGWRAKGYACDDYFAEAMVGLYSAEELGAMVDENGRPVDPSDVKLPEGYEPEERPPDPKDEPVDEDTREALRARLAALPEHHRKAAADLWRAKSTEGKLHALNHLTVRELVFATAIVSSAEQAAKADGWKPSETPPAPTEAPLAEEATTEPVAEAQEPAQAVTEPSEAPAEADPAEPVPPPVTPHLAWAEKAVALMTPRIVNAALRAKALEVSPADAAVNAERLVRSMADEHRDEAGEVEQPSLLGAS